MNILFKETPTLFGSFHICFLIFSLISSIIIYFLYKNKTDKQQLLFLKISGILMFIFEIWKQIFTYHYVFDDIYNMWFFPFQLCSMSMYCCILLLFIKDDKQNIILVFLSTYSLLASLVALIGPLDMLRPQVLLTFHGFIYHCVMLYQAIVSYLILRKRNNYKFKPTFYLFLIMVGIAEVINVISHNIFHDIHRESNMFYISPYYPTTQPVFNMIANKYGILIEVIFYLGIISLVSYLIYYLSLKIKKK